MKGVIWLLLLAVVAVVAASMLGPNDGLVSIYWGGWRSPTAVLSHSGIPIRPPSLFRHLLPSPLLLLS
jgi:hypothetical protein